MERNGLEEADFEREGGAGDSVKRGLWAERRSGGDRGQDRCRSRKQKGYSPSDGGPGGYAEPRELHADLLVIAAGKASRIPS